MQSARLDSVIIIQSLLTICPAMLLVSMGAPRPAAYAFFAVLLTFLSWSLLRGAQVTALGLTIGVLPGLMLLRNLFLYNSVILIYGVVIGSLLLRSHRHAQMWRRAGFLWFFYLCTLYWIISYMFTGDYFANLRLLEMALSASTLVLLMSSPVQLASALYSLIMSLTAMGVAFLPYGQRLGYATIDDVSLGNPIQYGLPLAFVLTMLIADRGKWLLLQRNPPLRIALTAVTGALLLLSTSRGSWLVAAAVLMMVVLFHRSDRGIATAAICLIALSSILLLQSRRGNDLATGFERTFDSSHSLKSRTSGRSDQWMILPAVMKDAPVLGFGPGMGKSVYAKYSLLNPRVQLHPGHRIAWHSLYMQIAVEAGGLGLGILTVLFVVMFRSNIRAWRRTGEITPLLGAVGFSLIALTVSGIDAASGLFLGLGLAVVGPDSLPSPLDDSTDTELPADYT